jgi:hypothetical protein
MTRRKWLGGVFGFVIAACGQTSSRAEGHSMGSTAPPKLHLIPDGDRIVNVGRLVDGRLYFVDVQLDPNGGSMCDVD